MATVVTRIALEGGEAVVKSLNAIGDAGSKAVKDIQTHVQGLNLSGLGEKFSRVGETAQKSFALVGQAAVKLGGYLGIALGGGVTALAGSLLTLAKSGASAVGAMNSLAKATGSTLDEMAGLAGVFGKAGIGTDQLADRFKRLAVATEHAWTDIKESVAKASATAKRDQLSVAEGALGIEQAQLNLSKAQAEAAAASGSRDPDRQIASRLAVRQAQLSVEKALLSEGEARQKQIDNETNSVANLTRAVNDLIKGQGEAASKLSAEQLFKGIVAGAAEASASLRGVQGSFQQIAAGAGPRTFDVLLRLADVMKNTKDETLKTALAAQVFGREVDQSMIKQLSRGAEAFRQESAELKRLGLAITEADTAAVEGFKQSVGKLTSYIGLVKDKIGVLFSPLFKQLFDTVGQIFTANIQRIQTFATSVRDLIAPILLGIVNAMRGLSFDEFKKQVGNSLPPEVVERVKAWQRAFEAVAFAATLTANIIGGSFKVVYTILDGILTVINKIAGTKINVEDIGIGLMILRFTGLLGIITKVISFLGTLGGSTSLLSGLLGWPALLVAAFVAAVVLIVKNWDTIVAAGKAALDGIKNIGTAIGNFFVDLGTKIAGIFTGVIDKAAKACSFLRNLFGGGGNQPAAAGAEAGGSGGVEKASGGLVGYASGGYVPGFAEGGQVQQAPPSSLDVQIRAKDIDDVRTSLVHEVSPAKAKQIKARVQEGAGVPGIYSSAARAGGGTVTGPGHDTSDNILARLSPGEYVVRAAAVRRVGVGFLDRINSAPGMAMGGLVATLRDGLASIAPRFASGGLATSSGLRPFTLVMPGAGSFGGLYAQESSVNHMRRAAVHAQVASTGRRPAWVK